MIVTSPALRDTRYSSALTYVEITTLSREDLDTTVVNFPRSERFLRVTALKIAMQRAGQIIATQLQTRQKAKALSSVLTIPGKGSDDDGDHTDRRTLKEMIEVINGGKKMRVYNEEREQIVDENDVVIDEHYVQRMVQQQQQGVETTLAEIRLDLAAVVNQTSEGRRELQDLLHGEREAMRAERAAIAAEREAYRTLLQRGGGALSGPAGGGGAKPGRGRIPSPRHSPAGGSSLTVTKPNPPSRSSSPPVAQGALVVKGEKRYRRRKKGTGGNCSPGKATTGGGSRRDYDEPPSPDADLAC